MIGLSRLQTAFREDMVGENVRRACVWLSPVSFRLNGFPIRYGRVAPLKVQVRSFSANAGGTAEGHLSSLF